MNSPLHLYIKRSSPRTLVLAPASSAVSSKSLVFRQQSAQSQTSNVIIVEFVPTSDLGLDSGDFRRWQGHVAGVLGLVEGGGSQEAGGSPVRETFLVLACGTRKVGNVRPATNTSPAEPVSRLLTVSYHSLTSSTWDADPALIGSDDVNADSASLRTSQYEAPAPQPLFPHPLAGMKKILEAGSFFFADGGSWDLSSRVEERLRRAGEGDAGVSLEETGEQACDEDRRFVWNQFLLSGLRDFAAELEDDERAELDAWGVILPLIQGFVSTATIPLPYVSESLTLALVSRLSSRRAGTRFNSRGVDEDGNTANFVETETILSIGDISMSWTQVRGSVPLFWEQQGMQAFGQKLQITRPPQVSQLAFEKHFDELVDVYQRVHNLNLLGTKDQEVVLSTSYNDHLKAYSRSKPPPPLVAITNFDFHGAVRVGGAESVRTGIRALPAVRDAVEGFGWTLVDAASSGKAHVIEEQRGVFRTNCLDCLDRTNVVCEILSAAVVERFVSSVNPTWVNLPQLWTHHSNLWADNGDLLSKVYAGTGAINTSFTRTGKRTLGGLLSDASKSVGRAYINNFTDASKQVSIDMLLGMRADQRPIEIHDPLLEKHREMMEQRSSEFRSCRKFTANACTWNLNGKSPSEDLLPWLLPTSSEPTEPDLISVAFQEIVPLNAQQIVQTDPAKLRLWEKVITDTLAKRPGKEFDYLLLRSEQLVGTALIVFIKDSLAGAVRKVESTTKKTGLRGMSGNKGGVAIRLDLFDTSICFVTAHLAAGHSNVQERNSDFHTIEAGLRFLRGKTLRSHDIVLFAGDFNYRIDLPNEDARALAAEKDVPRLLLADQLQRVMREGAAFGGYTEGDICFLPTYKYDNGTDDYDTSEKARVPAYTDRVVYRGSDVELRSYNRAELRTSDHRPVIGRFQGNAQVVDKARRAAVSKEVKEHLRTGNSIGLLDDMTSRLGQVGTHDRKNESLPAPSSEASQWWSADGKYLAGVAAEPPLGKGNPWAAGETTGGLERLSASR